MVGRSVANGADSLAAQRARPGSVSSTSSCRPVPPAATSPASTPRRPGWPLVPRLHTRLGLALDPDVALADAGVGPGAILVAVGEHTPTAVRGRRSCPPRSGRVAAEPGRLSVAVVLGRRRRGSARRLVRGPPRRLGPAHRRGRAPWARPPPSRCCRSAGSPRHRMVAAPAFAFAAAYAAAWDPAPERLPTVHRLRRAHRRGDRGRRAGPGPAGRGGAAGLDGHRCGLLPGHRRWRAGRRVARRSSGRSCWCWPCSPCGSCPG